MKVEIENTGLLFHPETRDDEEELEDFADSTAYFVDGARFSRDYQLGRWDGREMLLTHAHGKWRAPVGLLEETFERFGEIDVIDLRRSGGVRLPLRMNRDVIPSLRDYQEEAKDSILEDRGVLTGKGLLRLPTRSGKTVIAAETLADLGVPGLFIVNSDMLLQQTISFFRKVLISDAEPPDGMPLVGQYGGGVNEIGWITVASVQSLTAHFKKKAVKRLLKWSMATFFDECHHLEAPSWRRVMNSCDSLYKIGLSATIYLDKNMRRAEKGTIWLIGATGPVIYELEPSALIDAGWLCRPRITFVSAPPLDWADPDELDPIDTSTFATVYRVGIVEHEARNRMIAKIAREEVDEGRRVLITARQIKHVDALKRALKGQGVDCVVVTGKTPSKQRRALTDLVRTRVKPVLLGTVFGEAVDLPFLECVIIADAGASKILAMQRLRNLTPVDENDKARTTPMSPSEIVPVYDFADFVHKTLRRHTQQRLRAYRAHRAFIIRWREE